MPALSQDGRLLQVKTVLGAGVVLLRRLSVTETLEQPYAIQGELVSADPALAVDPKKILGTAITCTIDWTERGLKRHFHGIVTGFGPVDGTLRDHSVFRFEAAPALWLLTRTMDCRIFQEKSVQQIIQAVVDERGVGPVTFKHMPSGTRTYCTQFNETDLDFVQRLLDEVGATYFFEQGEGTDGWTITGSEAGFPSGEAVKLTAWENEDRSDAVTNWSGLNVIQPGAHTAWDFDNLKPSQLLTADAPTVVTGIAKTSGLKLYRWPGGQAVRPDASPATAALRMRRHEAGYETRSGQSTWITLAPGVKVEVDDKRGAAFSGRITQVTHEAFDESYFVEQGSTGYVNSFACIPADRPWRSPVHRPRPVVGGLQSAIVTGPSGEEQHCDAKGRIKVHFLWDHRDDKKNETSSCYVRVMQPFAGKWGGGWFLPRIGDEVLIAFLDGDPDRPICVGSIFNEDGPPMWGLPGHITRSGFRSRSTKGGGRDNANIVGFDDKKGSEQLYLQAEKDYLELVKNQKKVTVKGNEIRDVTGESPDQADGKRTTTVKGDETLEVKQGNLSTTVKQGDETRTVTLGKRTTSINGNETLEVKQGNRETTVKMGNDKLTVSMGNMEVTVSLGNITIKAPVGSITMEALQGITLKCGPTTSVELTPQGVTLKGMMIESKATMMNNTEGLMSTHKGTAMEQISGGIIMIG